MKHCQLIRKNGQMEDAFFIPLTAINQLEHYNAPITLKEDIDANSIFMQQSPFGFVFETHLLIHAVTNEYIANIKVIRNYHLNPQGTFARSGCFNAFTYVRWIEVVESFRKKRNNGCVNPYINAAELCFAYSAYLCAQYHLKDVGFPLMQVILEPKNKNGFNLHAYYVNEYQAIYVEPRGNSSCIYLLNSDKLIEEDIPRLVENQQVQLERMKKFQL